MWGEGGEVRQAGLGLALRLQLLLQDATSSVEEAKKNLSMAGSCITAAITKRVEVTEVMSSKPAGFNVGSGITS